MRDNLRKQTAHGPPAKRRCEALAQIGQQRQLLAGQTARDPDRAARDALAAQEARLAELNGELEKLERSLIPPERMNQVLKNVVQGHGRHPGCRLQDAQSATGRAAGRGRRGAARVLSPRI